MSEVDHPHHYNFSSELEVIVAIEESGLGFHLGNVLKYLARCKFKHPTPIKDLEKARTYLLRYGQLEHKPAPSAHCTLKPRDIHTYWGQYLGPNLTIGCAAVLNLDRKWNYQDFNIILESINREISSALSSSER